MFAIALAEFVRERSQVLEPLQVWTSTMKRTVETAAKLDVAKDIRRWSCLSEINAGDFSGLTYAEIKLRYPCDYERRQQDKLSYRYPNGESVRIIVDTS